MIDSRDSDLRVEDLDSDSEDLTISLLLDL